MQNWNSDNYVRSAIADASLNSAGTADINGVAVDTAGWDTVAALVKLGTIVGSAVTSLKWQGSADNITWADLEDSGQTVADDNDNQWFVMVLQRPKDHYVRLVIDRGVQNSTVVSAVYILSGPRYSKRTQATEVEAVKLVRAPNAGTA